MRTQQQFLNAYAASHQHPLNQRIHYYCVPAIVFSTLALLWAIPIGRWLGFEPTVAPYVNIVTLALLPVAIFYLRLSFAGFVSMMLWYFASVAIIVWIQTTLGTGWLVAIGAAIWIASWALQFYGHEKEGARPSFVEDLVFLLIGPLFVMDKFYRRIGRGGL